MLCIWNRKILYQYFNLVILIIPFASFFYPRYFF